MASSIVHRVQIAVVLLASVLPCRAALADAVEEPKAAAAAAEGEAAPEGQGQRLPWQAGPRSIDLGHQIQLALPSGYSYLAQPEAGALMEKMGNLYNDNLLGLVIGEGEESPWFVTLRYDAEGYVKDDESIDAEELLGSM